jgi:hypothetical protein
MPIKFPEILTKDTSMESTVQSPLKTANQRAEKSEKYGQNFMGKASGITADLVHIGSEANQIACSYGPQKAQLGHQKGSRLAKK